MFYPNDAFIAYLNSGNVSYEYFGPDAIPIVVADFVVNGVSFEAIYRDSHDVWEISDVDGMIAVADRGHKFYEYAERTVEKFKDKMLSGPSAQVRRGRLVKAMTKRIIKDMDEETVNNMRSSIDMFLTQFRSLNLAFKRDLNIEIPHGIISKSFS